HRVRQRAGARAGEQDVRGHAVRDELRPGLDALLDRQRVRLAGGAEDREAVAAVVQQPAAVGGERRAVDREVVAQRRQRGGEDAPHTTSPCRTVFSVTTRGSTKCSRYAGPPALVPVPDSRLPPNGWRPTIAPVISRLTYRLPTGERSST